MGKFAEIKRSRVRLAVAAHGWCAHAWPSVDVNVLQNGYTRGQGIHGASSGQ